MYINIVISTSEIKSDIRLKYKIYPDFQHIALKLESILNTIFSHLWGIGQDPKIQILPAPACCFFGVSLPGQESYSLPSFYIRFQGVGTKAELLMADTSGRWQAGRQEATFHRTDSGPPCLGNSESFLHAQRAQRAPLVF